METEFESRPLRPGSLIWSQDNVLALVTPSNLHIFAPSLRHTVDPTSTNFIVSSIPAQTLEQDNAAWKLTTHGMDLTRFLFECYIAASAGILDCCMVANWMLAYQTHVILDRYIAAFWDAEQEVDLEMADKIECVSLAWSPKIFMHGIGSLLALGNKSGDITIWNVVDPQNIRCVASMDTSAETWVTQMSWSPWTVDEGNHVTMLAYSLADGTVHVRKVTFNPTAPLENIDVSENILSIPVPSLHPCTVLRWSTTLPEASDRPNNLAFSKGNRLYIWLAETKKVLVWRKPIAKAISDISWDAYGTKVFVFFMDGKHSVLNVSDDGLSVNEDSVEFVHQNIISRCHLQSKTNLTQEEGEADDDGVDEEASGGGVGSKLQLHIVCGNRSAEGFQLATAYHVSSSFHMEFQRERFQSCTMVLTNTYKDVSGQTGDVLLKRLATFIRLPSAVLTRNPSFFLWELLVFIYESASRQDADAEYVKKLLAVLDDDDTTITESMRTFARREAMEDNSASFKSRDDTELLELAEKTYNLLQNQLQDLCDIDEQMDVLHDLKKGLVSTITSFRAGRESCPACGAEVRLDSELKGTCANHHAWQRCAVTLQLIADFHPRTCSGCSRKVLKVPEPKTEPSPLHDSSTAPWLEVILRAIGVCGFCGERFFTALRRKGT
ncbi:hypothetical protein BGZ72_004910 [Mortierella alpina]|nr:hypothetical protein BGZ72_004910 [Mortierella alpina]